MIPQFGQRLRVEVEIVASPSAFLVYESGGLENVQVLRDSRTAYGDLHRKLANCARAFSQEVEDGLAGRIREGGQQLLSVSHDLR